MTNFDLSRLIHDVPDFPREGVVFKDITPLLADADAFSLAVEQLAERVARHEPQGIMAIESRGFVFGAAVALKLGLPLRLVRKSGKLPRETESVSYQLEYGTDELEVHADSICHGESYAIVDDVIATGGTAAATARLVEKLGGRVACLVFLIEIEFLDGRRLLDRRPIEVLLQF